MNLRTNSYWNHSGIQALLLGFVFSMCPATHGQTFYANSVILEKGAEKILLYRLNSQGSFAIDNDKRVAARGQLSPAETQRFFSKIRDTLIALGLKPVELYPFDTGPHRPNSAELVFEDKVYRIESSDKSLPSELQNLLTQMAAEWIDRERPAPPQKPKEAATSQPRATPWVHAPVTLRPANTHHPSPSQIAAPHRPLTSPKGAATSQPRATPWVNQNP